MSTLEKVNSKDLEALMDLIEKIQKEIECKKPTHYMYKFWDKDRYMIIRVFDNGLYLERNWGYCTMSRDSIEFRYLPILLRFGKKKYKNAWEGKK